MKNSYLSLLLICLGVVLRLLPHAPNVAPIGALALVSGAYLPRKWAVAVPFVALFVSDLFLGFHDTMVWVYGAYALITFVALYYKPIKWTRIVSLSLFASLLFFIITNFGVWLTTSMYDKSFSGLVECYTMALPFFRNTLVGDLFYSLIFHYVLARINLMKIRFAHFAPTRVIDYLSLLV